MNKTLKVSNVAAERIFNPVEVYSEIRNSSIGEINEAGLQLFRQNRTKWIISRSISLRDAIKRNDRMVFTCVLKDLAAGIGVNEAIKIASRLWLEPYYGEQNLRSLFFDPAEAFREAELRFNEGASKPLNDICYKDEIFEAVFVHALEKKDMLLLSIILDECILNSGLKAAYSLLQKKSTALELNL